MISQYPGLVVRFGRSNLQGFGRQRPEGWPNERARHPRPRHHLPWNSRRPHQPRRCRTTRRPRRPRRAGPSRHPRPRHHLPWNSRRPHQPRRCRTTRRPRRPRRSGAPRDHRASVGGRARRAFRVWLDAAPERPGGAGPRLSGAPRDHRASVGGRARRAFRVWLDAAPERPGGARRPRRPRIRLGPSVGHALQDWPPWQDDTRRVLGKSSYGGLADPVSDSARRSGTPCRIGRHGRTTHDGCSAIPELMPDYGCCLRPPTQRSSITSGSR